MTTTPRRDEGGAVAVVVAIVSVVLFAGAAYSIDLGNLWQTRRHMVTATDASALAAAGEYAVGEDGCASAASWLAANRADATLDACTPSGTDTRSGHVTVDGHTNVPFTFAGIFGINDEDVSAATTAAWGLPASAIGLRPIALCITATSGLKEWLNLPDGPTGPTATPLTVTLSNDQPDPCTDDNGSAAGNWGLALGDGNNSNSDTVDWILNGYDQEVEIGEAVHANPGSFSGSAADALETLVDTQAWFPLPVFDRVIGTNGNNAEYHVVAFVFVQLVDFKTNGAQANRYITINLDRGVITGRCCNGTLDTGTRVVRICAVDTREPDSLDDVC